MESEYPDPMTSSYKSVVFTLHQYPNSNTTGFLDAICERR